MYRSSRRLSIPSHRNVERGCGVLPTLLRQCASVEHGPPPATLQRLATGRTTSAAIVSATLARPCWESGEGH
jgi:hypothetical protein